MRLYLVRHGEAEGNRERQYLGWEDVPLTPTGESNVRSLARHLAGFPLTGVVTSDLVRAVATAAAIVGIFSPQTQRHFVHRRTINAVTYLYAPESTYGFAAPKVFVVFTPTPSLFVTVSPP